MFEKDLTKEEFDSLCGKNEARFERPYFFSKKTVESIYNEHVEQRKFVIFDTRIHRYLEILDIQPYGKKSPDYRDIDLSLSKEQSLLYNSDKTFMFYGRLNEFDQIKIYLYDKNEEIYIVNDKKNNPIMSKSFLMYPSIYIGKIELKESEPLIFIEPSIPVKSELYRTLLEQFEIDYEEFALFLPVIYRDVNGGYITTIDNNNDYLPCYLPISLLKEAVTSNSSFVFVWNGKVIHAVGFEKSESMKRYNISMGALIDIVSRPFIERYKKMKVHS